MVKCPNCNNELKQIKGKVKFASQIGNTKKKEYILKVVYPNITIQEEAKEDFKELMGWDEQTFMSHVIVKLKGKKRTNGDIINSINQLLGFTEYKDEIKWSNANKEEMLRLEGAIKKFANQKLDKGEKLT